MSEALPPTDDQLAHRAQTGDRAALEALVLRHQEEVARLLWRFAQRPADLDDLVQDAFLRLVRGLPGWRADQPFIHWLRRLTVNTGRDYCRRHAVRRRWMQEPPATPHDPDAPGFDPIQQAPDAAPNPAARAAANEVKERLAQLAPDDRTVLTLQILEGWSLPDIARSCGWTHAATKLRAWRARARLRALLEDSPVTPSLS